MISTEQKIVARKFLQAAVTLGELPNKIVDEILTPDQSNSSTIADTLLTKKETALFLKCSTRQIDLLTKKGLLRKYYTSTSSPRFLKEEVMKFVIKGRKKA